MDFHRIAARIAAVPGSDPNQCKACHGTGFGPGFTDCQKCNGTGATANPSTNLQCKKCRGTGFGPGLSDCIECGGSGTNVGPNVIAEDWDVNFE